MNQASGDPDFIEKVLGEFQCCVKPSTSADWSKDAIQTHALWLKRCRT
jgi:hypothetical protein